MDCCIERLSRLGVIDPDKCLVASVLDSCDFDIDKTMHHIMKSKYCFSKLVYFLLCHFIWLCFDIFCYVVAKKFKNHLPGVMVFFCYVINFPLVRTLNARFLI